MPFSDHLPSWLVQGWYDATGQEKIAPIHVPIKDQTGVLPPAYPREGYPGPFDFNEKLLDYFEKNKKPKVHEALSLIEETSEIPARRQLARILKEVTPDGEIKTMREGAGFNLLGKVTSDPFVGAISGTDGIEMTLFGPKQGTVDKSFNGFNESTVLHELIHKADMTYRKKLKDSDKVDEHNSYVRTLNELSNDFLDGQLPIKDRKDRVSRGSEDQHVSISSPAKSAGEGLAYFLTDFETRRQLRHMPDVYNFRGDGDDNYLEEYDPKIIGLFAQMGSQTAKEESDRLAKGESTVGWGSRIGGLSGAERKSLASKGRFGDSIVAHINPAEAQLLSMRRGAPPSINPETGLPEFFDVNDLYSGAQGGDQPYENNAPAPGGVMPEPGFTVPETPPNPTEGVTPGPNTQSENPNQNPTDFDFQEWAKSVGYPGVGSAGTGQSASAVDPKNQVDPLRGYSSGVVQPNGDEINFATNVSEADPEPDPDSPDWSAWARRNGLLSDGGGAGDNSDRQTPPAPAPAEPQPGGVQEPPPGPNNNQPVIEGPDYSGYEGNLGNELSRIYKSWMSYLDEQNRLGNTNIYTAANLRPWEDQLINAYNATNDTAALEAELNGHLSRIGIGGGQGTSAARLANAVRARLAALKQAKVTPTTNLTEQFLKYLEENGGIGRLFQPPVVERPTPPVQALPSLQSLRTMDLNGLQSLFPGSTPRQLLEMFPHLQDQLGISFSQSVPPLTSRAARRGVGTRGYGDYASGWSSGAEIAPARQQVRKGYGSVVSF